MQLRWADVQDLLSGIMLRAMGVPLDLRLEGAPLKWLVWLHGHMADTRRYVGVHVYLRLLLAGWQSAAGQPVWWRRWVPEVCELPTNWCRNRIRYACDRPGELPLAVGYGAQMLYTEVHEMG